MQSPCSSFGLRYNKETVSPGAQTVGPGFKLRPSAVWLVLQAQEAGFVFEYVGYSAFSLSSSSVDGFRSISSSASRRSNWHAMRS